VRAPEQKPRLCGFPAPGAARLLRRGPVAIERRNARRSPPVT
jgi:hypothetical protein